MKGLEKLSRADLIWLISEIKRHVGGVYAVERAYNELKFKKARDTSDKAYECGKKACECVSRYVELMKPYEGKRVIDIPSGVLIEAQKALEERIRLEAEYDKYNREHERWLKMASEG